jgi:hypothetical protein
LVELQALLAAPSTEASDAGAKRALQAIEERRTSGVTEE